MFPQHPISGKYHTAASICTTSQESTLCWKSKVQKLKHEFFARSLISRAVGATRIHDARGGLSGTRMARLSVEVTDTFGGHDADAA